MTMGAVKDAGFAPIQPIDWRQWMPPKTLPDTGNKVFLIGEVWAWCVGDEWEVFRVMGIGDIGQAFAKTLAWNLGPSFARDGYVWPNSIAARHSVLVQRAEPGWAPIDPKVLYGGQAKIDVFNKYVDEIIIAIPKPTPKPRDLCKRDGCSNTNKAAWSSVREVYCSTKCAIADKPKPEVWIPSIDDYDLLPDA